MFDSPFSVYKVNKAVFPALDIYVIDTFGWMYQVIGV